MKLENFESILSTCLEDGKISRGEEKALRALMRDDPPSVDQLHAMRKSIFTTASQMNPSVQLEWLETITKLLLTSVDPKPEVEQTVFFSPGDEPLNEIIRCIRGAKRTISVCVFTITDDRISEALLQADKRKVAIQIISDQDKSFDRGSDIRELAESGIRVALDNTTYHMHHKFAIFDHAILITGSYNWTRSAANHNEENILKTNDMKLIKQFQAMFDELWEKFT